MLELVRRRRLAEEYSALWIVSAVALIGISLRRDVLDFAASWMGVYYPPAVLVLMLVAIISVASLSFSVILSRQQRQIERLIEENAIMAAELRELRWDPEPKYGEACRPPCDRPVRVRPGRRRIGRRRGGGFRAPWSRVAQPLSANRRIYEFTN